MSGQYDILKRVLSDRPVAFHPELARVFGGVSEALFFQQIAFWMDKGDDPAWIYKTQAEIEYETTLSRYQQEQARKTLKRLGVLSEQKRGLPAKLYYRVEWEALFALLDASSQHPRMRETRRLARENPTSSQTPTQDRGELPDQDAGNPQAFIGTENTTESIDRDPSIKSTGITRLVRRDDAERITFLIGDIGQEFADQASIRASASRAVNLYAESRLTLEEFFDVVQAARIRTKRYTGNIRTERVELHGQMVRPKMAYFFRVLESLLGEEEMPSTGS